MGIMINELIEFCEEEEYTHRIRCKQYDNASGFTRTGNNDIRTACAIREEVKGNYYQQIIDTMRKYQKIEEILKEIPYGGDATVRRIQEVMEDDNGIVDNSSL